eukprot:SAG25_NODE_196_length_12129_cov_57.802826_15_plen_98_part_01
MPAACGSHVRGVAGTRLPACLPACLPVVAGAEMEQRERERKQERERERGRAERAGGGLGGGLGGGRGAAVPSSRGSSLFGHSTEDSLALQAKIRRVLS